MSEKTEREIADAKAGRAARHANETEEQARRHATEIADQKRRQAEEASEYESPSGRAAREKREADHDDEKPAPRHRR